MKRIHCAVCRQWVSLQLTGPEALPRTSGAVYVLCRRDGSKVCASCVLERSPRDLAVKVGSREEG